jgi:SAM-dependent methyltransferase
MKKYVKTLKEREHLVLDEANKNWVRVAHSKSLLNQFDSWKMEQEKTGLSIRIVDVTLRDFVSGGDQPGSREQFVCHMLTIMYSYADELLNFGIIPDEEVYAKPHQSIVYDKIKNAFFEKKRTGRVFSPTPSPIFTYFDNTSMIDMLPEGHTMAGIPLQPHSYDYLILDHVMESCRNPHELVRDAHRILRPGGTLIVVEPLVGIFKESTAWRVTPQMLEKMLKEFYTWKVNTWGNRAAMLHMISSGGGWGALPRHRLRELLTTDDNEWPLFVWAIAEK